MTGILPFQFIRNGVDELLNYLVPSTKIVAKAADLLLTVCWIEC